MNSAIATSNDFLKLSRKEMQILGYQVMDIIIDHFESVHRKPVMNTAEASELRKKIHESIPIKGVTPQIAIEQLQKNVFSNLMHHDHPRFFAYVPSPNNFVSVMADALASGFNVFAGSYQGASGAAEIELITIDWLRQLCGLPVTAGGLFVSGGTKANLTALAVARRVKLQDKVQNAVIYCSDQTHSSIERVVRILGFDRTQINKLPSDKNFRLSLSDLKCAIAKDRLAGKFPFCIIANAGTTNTGAIDPLYELADICSEEGLWLHVDGAYGVGSILSDKGRSLLRGLELCDSVSLDPHKRLFQSYEAGCLLIRNREWLKETFCMRPEYLSDTEPEEEEINFYDHGIQLTRSFRALKLWMSLKVFGLEVFQKAVEQGIFLAELAEKILRKTDYLEVVTPAQLGIVTFRYFPGYNFSLQEIDTINHKIVDKMTTDGFAFVSSTKLKNCTVLRMCTINPSTTEVDIRETIQQIEYFGKNIMRSMLAFRSYL